MRAARALAHLAEVDPALAVLALWCQHRDGEGATQTQGDVIAYGPGFATLGLPEQVGLAAHHVLHVALRHSDRQAGLAERLGAGFDPMLFALAADGIVNETLILAGHALPRPAVTLTEVLAQAGIPAASAVAALERWDADRLAMALHADPGRAQRARDYGRARGFAADVQPGADGGGPGAQGRPSAQDWRNHMLRAIQAGQRAGVGIGRLGAILADLTPGAVPWEVHLRGLLARALADRPQPTWRRPAGRWVALMDHAARTGAPPPAFQPGRTRTTLRPRLAVGIDTSSSIPPPTLRLFMAEAQGIARRTGAEVHVLAFDDTVSDQVRLDPGARWPDRPLRTGGGTDYHDLFDRMVRLSPTCAVVLTDLDAPLPPAPPVPLIWAVAGRAPDPPYGRVVRLDDLEG